MANTEKKGNYLDLDDSFFPDEVEGDDELAFPDGASEDDYDQALTVSSDFLTPVTLTSEN